MEKRDPYLEFPTYETEHFLVRQIAESDAADLLCCYADPQAVSRMNADNCTSNFFYRTEGEMRACIRDWLEEYGRRAYARPAVVEKASGRAVGTLEAFGGDPGVLRLDISSHCETESLLRELYALAADRFPEDFPMTAMVTKAPPWAGERIRALASLGFQGPEEFRRYHDYYRKSR